MSRMLMVAALVSMLSPSVAAAADDDEDRRGFFGGGSMGAGWSTAQCLGSNCQVPALFEGRLGRVVTPRVALLVEAALFGPADCGPYMCMPIGTLVDAGLQYRPSPRTFLRAAAGAGQNDYPTRQRATAFRPAFTGAMGLDIRPFEGSEIDGEFELRFSAVQASGGNTVPSDLPPNRGWVKVVTLNIGFTWYERTPRPTPAPPRSDR